MLIDLTKLNYNKSIDIDETYSFTKEELKGTDIIALDNVKIKGKIERNEIDEYIITMNIKVVAVLPSSLTLKPTDYPLDIIVEENLEELDESFKKNQKTIDILPIIWENILMEIPIKITNPEEENIITKGDGWELITEKKETENPFEKLKDLF